MPEDDDCYDAGTWAAGGGEDLDARLLGGGERRDRTRGDRLVVAQQSAAEIGGDQPFRRDGEASLYERGRQSGEFGVPAFRVAAVAGAFSRICPHV
jgi:hypothetical protein